MKRKGTFIKIRKIVSKIPKGKVVTYDNIAEVVGLNDARIVGWALRGNQDPKIFAFFCVRNGDKYDKRLLYRDFF